MVALSPTPAAPVAGRGIQLILTELLILQDREGFAGKCAGSASIGGTQLQQRFGPQLCLIEQSTFIRNGEVRADEVTVVVEDG